MWRRWNMPAVSHAETNVLSSSKNPNVRIPGAFNNNVVSKSGAMNIASRRVRREQGTVVDDVRGESGIDNEIKWTWSRNRLLS